MTDVREQTKIAGCDFFCWDLFEGKGNGFA